MLGTFLAHAELALWLKAVAVVLIVAGSTISGHRMHRWLFYNGWPFIRRLPVDLGAWLGFAAGVAVLFL